MRVQVPRPEHTVSYASLLSIGLPCLHLVPWESDYDNSFSTNLFKLEVNPNRFNQQNAKLSRTYLSFSMEQLIYLIT